MASGVHLTFFGSFVFGTPGFPLSDVPLSDIAEQVKNGQLDAAPARVFLIQTTSGKPTASWKPVKLAGKWWSYWTDRHCAGATSHHPAAQPGGVQGAGARPEPIARHAGSGQRLLLIPSAPVSSWICRRWRATSWRCRTGWCPLAASAFIEIRSSVVSFAETASSVLVTVSFCLPDLISGTTFSAANKVLVILKGDKVVGVTDPDRC